MLHSLISLVYLHLQLQSGFAKTAGLSTNTNFIDVDSTDAKSSHPITFIDSDNEETFHKLKIDASGGLLFNPFDNLLTVGEVSIAGILTVGGASTVYNTLDVFQKTTLKNELEVDGAAVFDNSVELNSTLLMLMEVLLLVRLIIDYLL